MKQKFFLLFSFLVFLFSCGEKKEAKTDHDPAFWNDGKVLLTHDEYTNLVRQSMKAELEYELVKKAARGEALELLIKEGWGPCCGCNKEALKMEHPNSTTPQTPKTRNLAPRGFYFPENIQITESESLRTQEVSQPKDTFYANQNNPTNTNTTTISPVFNNYFTPPQPQVAESNIVKVTDTVTLKTDTLVPLKNKPLQVEIGGGYGQGPFGIVRIGNERGETSASFLWTNKEKIANTLVDFVVKPKEGNSLRLGAFYHNEVAPKKWEIPSEETTTVSAGGVSTTISSTRRVQVEQWNINKQSLGVVVGLEKNFGKIRAMCDVMPGFSLDKEFVVHSRAQIGLKMDKRTSINVDAGVLNTKPYIGLSMRVQ